MSNWGAHPIATTAEARARRIEAGLKPCRLCERWFRILKVVRVCDRCCGDRKLLEKLNGVPH